MAASVKVLAVIQSRLSSARLPGKAMLCLAGLPSVLLCARRAMAAGGEVVVATSSDPTDDPIADLMDRNRVSLHRGSLDDVLDRMVGATSHLGDHDIVVRMTADNPFVDGSFVAAAAAQFEAMAVGYLNTSEILPRLPYGMVVEVTRAGDLREAAERGHDSYQREHVMPYIATKFGALSPVAAEALVPGLRHDRLPDLAGVRCTLDTLDDYIRLHRVFARVDDAVHVPWIDLCGLLAETATDDNTGDGNR